MYVFKLLILKFAIAISKIKGEGTSFAGFLNNKYKFNILKYVDFSDKKVIFVLGTNGKTTTANLINSFLLKDNKKVLYNSEGANLISGVVTTFIKRLKFNHTIEEEYILLEVDEKTLKDVVNVIKPNYVVITNFFRDQLDRYGEIDMIVDEIFTILNDLDINLIINGQDPLLVYSSRNIKNRTFYSLEQNKNSIIENNKTRDFKYCLNCINKLDYDFFHYAHIGDFYCSSCDFKFIKGEYVLNLDKHNLLIRNNNIVFDNVDLPIYMYNNILCAVALLDKLGIDVKDYLKDVISSFSFPRGRNQLTNFGEYNLYFNLAKNVVGFEESIEFIDDNFSKFDFIVCLNDEFADGKDISWIYDVNFSSIKDKVYNIYVLGSRKYDMALRLEIEGFDNINVLDEYNDITNIISNLNCDVVIISNYTGVNAITKVIDNVKG